MPITSLYNEFFFTYFNIYYNCNGILTVKLTINKNKSFTKLDFVLIAIKMISF
jgi:hypothetical protein